MAERVYNVLFLCTGNSARSIMAEAILNKDGARRFPRLQRRQPAEGRRSIRYALDLLRKSGYDTSGLRSKSWAEFAQAGAPELDFVFTVCDNAAGETCPLWPGQPITAHWGIPDPARLNGSEAEIALAFKDAYRMLKRRIDLFLALPISKLDRLVLTTRLKEIGRSERRDGKSRPCRRLNAI